MAKKKKRTQTPKANRSGGGWMTSLRTGFQNTVRGAPASRKKKRSPLRLVFEILFWVLVAALIFWGFSGAS